jgi:hypothetical protein
LDELLDVNIFFYPWHSNDSTNFNEIYYLDSSFSVNYLFVPDMPANLAKFNLQITGVRSEATCQVLIEDVRWYFSWG